MRLLLDESLPRRLRRHLAPHEVRTIPEMGWAGKKNGELLKLAESQFEAFLTEDQKLPSQQNLTALRRWYSYLWPEAIGCTILSPWFQGFWRR